MIEKNVKSAHGTLIFFHQKKKKKKTVTHFYFPQLASFSKQDTMIKLSTSMYVYIWVFRNRVFVVHGIN